MTPAVSLALLSVNVVALACVVYFATQAGAIAMVIRTGSDRGVRVSQRNRLLMRFGNWLAPVGHPSRAVDTHLVSTNAGRGGRSWTPCELGDRPRRFTAGGDTVARWKT